MATSYGPYGPYNPGTYSKYEAPKPKPTASSKSDNRYAALKPKPAPKIKPAPKARSVTDTGIMIPGNAFRQDGSAVSSSSLTRAREINQAIVDRNLPSQKEEKDLKEDLQTGSIETKTTPVPSTTDDPAAGDGTSATAEKPLDVTLGQEGMDAAQAAADAMRLFQSNQAKAQLTSALSRIDRSALDQYATIANDYAARGLARSGGKLQTEQKAEDEVSRVRADASQAVTDFLNELKLTGNLEQAKTNLGKSGAFQEYINDNYGTPGA
tara:strand:+ start:5933 stop:6733 length:801 start_codon:yes stop_codon:yes gene_type:complete